MMEEHGGIELEYDAAPRPSVGRARRHLLATTLPVAFYSAAYAGSLYWAATSLLREVAARTTYYAWVEATWRADVMLAWWGLGNFLPAWVIFSWYGFWLRRSGYDAPLPRALEATLTWSLVLLPWLWLVAAVRNPRVMLRNYKRRFRGETLRIDDEEASRGR